MLTLQEVSRIYEEEIKRIPSRYAPLRTRIRAAEPLFSDEALADLSAAARSQVRATDRMLAYASYWRRAQVAIYHTDSIVAQLMIERYWDWVEVAGYIHNEIPLPIPGASFRDWTTEAVAHLRDSVALILVKSEQGLHRQGNIMARSDWFGSMFTSALTFHRILLGEARANAILEKLERIGELIRQYEDVRRAGQRAIVDDLPPS